MKTRDRHPDDAGLKPMSPIRARLLKIWGPAEGWDNPLKGTKYDPALVQRRQVEKQRERLARRERRRAERAERRAGERPEHYGPDES